MVYLSLVRQTTISRFENITIGKVEPSDLETFHEHQLDPEAIRMAAFVGKDPRDEVVFDTPWDKILHSSQNITRPIVTEGHVAGSIACYPDGKNMEVTNWLGREFWGKRISDNRSIRRNWSITALKSRFLPAAEIIGH